MRPTTPIPWFCGLAVFLIMVSLGTFSSSANGAAAPSPNRLDEPTQAVDEGVPEVAVARLRAVLPDAPDVESWRALATKLAPALVAAHQPEEALRLLADARWDKSSAWNYWRGQALAALGKWSDALPCFQAATNGPFSADATMAAGQAYEATGQTDQALKTFSSLFRNNRWGTRTRLRYANLLLERSDWSGAERILDQANPTTTSDRKERRLLKARVELVRHRPDRALPTFESLATHKEGANHELIIAALFGVADSHMQLKTPEQGDDFLEDFIEHHPGDPSLPELFAKLDALYQVERKPSRTELERWSRDPEQPRRAFAQLYWARMDMRAGRREHALKLFDDLRRDGARIPGISGGYLEFAQVAAAEGQNDRAIAILEEARAQHPTPEELARIEMLQGELLFAAKRFNQATNRFEEAALNSAVVAAPARYNASLGWLEQGKQDQFIKVRDELQKSGADPESLGDLELNRGLVEAQKGSPSAIESLRSFIRTHPGASRLSEAWVALAEIAFHSTPPQPDEARRDLQRASESKPTAAAQEHADYLSIWIADSASGRDAEVIERANKFLSEHAASSFATDVRMKLAETYYRQQDFANAQTQFEIISGQEPGGPLAEKALFFAAESAMSTMGPRALDRAIELFDAVAQMKGDLRWAARNEEALIERRLNKPQDALLLYDEVLQGAAKPAEKREALCGKGDIFFELSSEDPKNLSKAIESYDELAAQSTPDGHWHNQALFKKGVCLEKKADRDGALSIFYSVLEEQTRPGHSPEFFWFYKAGFNAARLMEEASKWQSAASIYEKLVAAGGTRSEEAKARLDKLRLEHFLWSD
jgi:predicted negative regulator of RcsB-dependent stress response